MCVRIESANVHGSRQVSLQTRRKPENMHTQLESDRITFNYRAQKEKKKNPKLQIEIRDLELIQLEQILLQKAGCGLRMSTLL